MKTEKDNYKHLENLRLNKREFLQAYADCRSLVSTRSRGRMTSMQIVHLFHELKRHRLQLEPMPLKDLMNYVRDNFIELPDELFYTLGNIEKEFADYKDNSAMLTYGKFISISLIINEKDCFSVDSTFNAIRVAKPYFAKNMAKYTITERVRGRRNEFTTKLRFYCVLPEFKELEEENNGKEN